MLKSNDMEGGYLKIKVNGGGTGLTYGMSVKNNQEKMMKYLNFMD